MFKSTKVVIVYVFPNGGKGGFMEKAEKFIQTYHQFPPGMAHETAVVCNGSPVSAREMEIFAPLSPVTFLNHDNTGWDIGGFQAAAKTIDCDMMVFFGAHTYFRRSGWLARMHQIFQQLGPNLYGCTGNQGHLAVGVHPHVRTTAFWCPPSWMNEYPHSIKTMGGGGSRYEFEHGASCFTNWIKSRGLMPGIVGWDCVYPVDGCDAMTNGFHRGDQSNVLVGDRMTCPPYFAHP